MRAAFLAFLLLGCLSSNKKVTFDDAFSRAQAHDARKNTDEAIINFEIARDLNPARPEPYLNLSRIYLARGNSRRAFEYLVEGFEKPPAMPESALSDLFDLSTRPMMITVAMRKTTAVAGTRSFIDEGTRARVQAALKRHPNLLLAFADKLLDLSNVNDSFLLMKGFSCPPELRWRYLNLKVRESHLLGNEKAFDSFLAEILPLAYASHDTRRLYELGRICILQDEDDAALKLLQRARETVPPENTELLKSIEEALKHPERVLDNDGQHP
ncbi:MAG: hypothetical protein A2901_00970 [Elusimicrobia bacterium RIFCSPLOWO2_01_FULL_54_10]|nr:MAG: hypothetical protein A2901_00970 [Elusimicrobia bacterium RIFCSPLOWO2_01_FULL_54_10]